MCSLFNERLMETVLFNIQLNERGRSPSEEIRILTSIPRMMEHETIQIPFDLFDTVRISGTGEWNSKIASFCLR